MAGHDTNAVAPPSRASLRPWTAVVATTTTAVEGEILRHSRRATLPFSPRRLALTMSAVTSLALRNAGASPSSAIRATRAPSRPISSRATKASKSEGHSCS